MQTSVFRYEMKLMLWTIDKKSNQEIERIESI